MVASIGIHESSEKAGILQLDSACTCMYDPFIEIYSLPSNHASVQLHVTHRNVACSYGTVENSNLCTLSPAGIFASFKEKVRGRKGMSSRVRSRQYFEQAKFLRADQIYFGVVMLSFAGEEIRRIGSNQMSHINGIGINTNSQIHSSSQCVLCVLLLSQSGERVSKCSDPTKMQSHET